MADDIPMGGEAQGSVYPLCNGGTPELTRGLYFPFSTAGRKWQSSSSMHFHGRGRVLPVFFCLNPHVTPE